MSYAQQDSTQVYKKRVLESTEVDFLMSYYSQDGDNAAVTGGIGNEELKDITPTVIVSVPLSDDEVLTIDAGVSAYTSASSSNINPFDGTQPDPFIASTGASSGDVWTNVKGIYSHSSNDRNTIWTGDLSVATEYDYFSIGAGGSYTHLWNEKNTEVTLKANVFFDTWKLLYPYELRPFVNGGSGINDPLFSSLNTTYTPSNFIDLDSKNRNSYNFGFSFTQILSKSVQTNLAIDLVQQQGQLSTPFQRVYFVDRPDVFIQNFHLADDIERLPDTRFKIAIGGRLHWYLNEFLVLRTFYRFYTDDWGINSHTASVELPIKISSKFSVIPSYRYYNQSSADYFSPYNTHLSTNEFYTSDYDLSKFNSNQYGLGIRYTDIFTKFHLWSFGLKNIDIKFNQYERDSGLSSYLISGGVQFVMD